ncbi:MAG: hypothetical protein GWO81_07195 [Verrucomicrobia bacterium]|nr:hypothetical protein [Verrucomicrobiota bacterium]
MKSFLISLCLFALAGYLIAVLLGKVEESGIKDYIQELIEPSQARFEGFAPVSKKEEASDPELKFLEAENPYPVKLKIENMNGETLDIRLTGRSETNISFTREDDGQSFIYAINDLDSASRKKIRDFPALGIKNASNFLNKGLTLDEVHAEQLRLRAERLSGQMREAQAEAAISGSEVDRRTLLRKYEKYRAERLEILKDLNRRDSGG